MRIRALSTFTDWSGHAGCWGRLGVRKILETLKTAGVRDVYWRVFNGGMAMYPSHVAEVHVPHMYDVWKKNTEYPFPLLQIDHLKEIDFNAYDTIPDAIEIAEEYGMNLYLWYTIYEDSHGRPWRCSFNTDHPEYWHMDREGRSYSGTFDFYFDEVREYKHKIIDELLQYPAKGLMLDLVRHNATPSSDENCVYRFGFNPEIREAYKKEHGADPIDLVADDEKWLAWNRDVNTSMIREIREKMDATETFRELSLMLWPVDYHKWGCFDVPALTEDGSVQMLTTQSLAWSVRPAEAKIHFDSLKSQSKNEDVALLPGLQGYQGLFPDQVEDFVESAEESGAKEVMFYEADHIAKWHLTMAVRAVNLGISFKKRALSASKISNVDDSREIAWDQLPTYKDFLYHRGNLDGTEPSEETVVRIAYDENALYFQFECSEDDVDSLLTPPTPNPRQQFYLDALKSKGTDFNTSAVNLFLDPSRGRQDYHTFGVLPSGESAEACFVDGEWSAQWTCNAEIGDKSWTVSMRIPFQSLGVQAPSSGSEWGVNLSRGVKRNNEVSVWFPCSWQLPLPNELGLLTFE